MPTMTLKENATLKDKDEGAPKSGLAQKLPILVILAVAAAGAFFLRDQISFSTLAENREALIAFRDANYVLAVLTFVRPIQRLSDFPCRGPRLPR